MTHEHDGEDEGVVGFPFDPAAYMAQMDQKRMRGTDEANQFREFIMTADRETLELVYALFSNILNTREMGPMYMGIITGVLDQKHGVSMIDGHTDEERLAELEGADDAD